MILENLYLLDKKATTMYTGLAEKAKDQVIKFPHSRGDSGALYPQSATAGVMSCPGRVVAELPLISGVEVWVLRNRNL